MYLNNIFIFQSISEVDVHDCIKVIETFPLRYHIKTRNKTICVSASSAFNSKNHLQFIYTLESCIPKILNVLLNFRQDVITTWSSIMSVQLTEASCMERVAKPHHTEGILFLLVLDYKLYHH